MPLLPFPTIPYPAGSGAQAGADWCASSIAAQQSRLAAAQVWLMQRQWLADGGRIASYPLPVASGPAITLRLWGGAGAMASLPAAPTITFGPLGG